MKNALRCFCAMQLSIFGSYLEWLGEGLAALVVVIALCLPPAILCGLIWVIKHFVF